ncbi:hypothetical protein [Sinomonas soli]
MGRPAGWLDIDDVRKLSGWSKRWAREVAKRDGWLALNTKPKLYAERDVLASLGTHRDHAVEQHLLGKYVGPKGRHAGGGRVLTTDS